MTQNRDHTQAPPDAAAYRCPETGALLKTIANPYPQFATRQEHCLHVPQLCPASGNPGDGSRLYIRYVSQGRFLEVFSLHDYLRAFIGHPIVRDVEQLTQTVARDCASALGHAVQVQGHFELPGIAQSLSTLVETHSF